jgi:hypothetical protein
MVPRSPSPSVSALTLLLVAGLALAGAGGATAQADSTSLTTMNDTVRLHASENATVAGTTDLADGSELTVRLQSADDTSPRMIASEPATVGEDGSFVAAFNLSAYSPGDTFSVTVVRDGDTIASEDATVVASDVPVEPGGQSNRPVPGFGALAAALALALAVGALARRN